MRRLENLWASVFSFLHVCPGNRTQTVRLGTKPLSLRSHVAGSCLWVTGEYGNVTGLYSIEQEKVISFPVFSR